MELNARAAAIVDRLIADAERCRIRVVDVPGGGRAIDAGREAPGGLQAGLMLARACLADLAEVALVPGVVAGRPCPLVQVATDHPILACLASQFAGWRIEVKESRFFAMGSGPMRAAAGKESLFDTIGGREHPTGVVGVLEGRDRIGPEVVAKIAEACRVAPAEVSLLIAPTASLAGGVQVVARAVETALHKLMTLGFDLTRIVSAFGSAPLPPVAADDLAAIGRTNDAVLYGARVVLYVRGDDAEIAQVGPAVPSSSSPEAGEPFAAILARAGGEFYKVDPHLFSPAEVMFQNIQTGRSHRYGTIAEDVLARSFFDG